jgi:hypothetical protein
VLVSFHDIRWADDDFLYLGIVQKDCWSAEGVILGVQLAGQVERDGSGVVPTAR